MSQSKYLGMNVASVSVDTAVIDADTLQIIEAQYVRHHGRPMQAAAEAIRDVITRYGAQNLRGMTATGSGGRVVSQVLGADFVNEVVAQAAATMSLYPQVNTIVEIGGDDSKLILLKAADAQGRREIADFAMNTLCAAGTGSFLDKQASRLGLTIEQFGDMGAQVEDPPRVAGRCSVFAKSDMIHLQQKGTPTREIVAGVCHALVRNFKSTVASAAELEAPVAFQGGVAANAGIIKAMHKVLELDEEQLVIPEHFGCMGAIGAVLKGVEDGKPAMPDLDRLDSLAAYEEITEEAFLAPLKLEKSVIMPSETYQAEIPAGQKVPGYLGVDVGSISTNLVVIDGQGRLLSKCYLMTAGQPIDVVREGLKLMDDEVGHLVDIQGVCTTGSGRYLIGDFVGADVVKNEITAHARGALAIDPQVDTIFEIGGQDSKYISLRSGHVVDFTMNKVCAAGTGSFIEEQAEKLGISIKEEFAELALSAMTPRDLGERCTVFMETEMVKHQQAGATTAELVSGLAYSIVHNYLNQVVAKKPVGDHIFFQGGTAFNDAVVAAFEAVTGKPIIVPPHKEVLGAYGCAIIAMESDTGQGTSFEGFDLSEREYTVDTFVCHDCSNDCEMNRVVIEGREPLYYGSRCGKFDVDKTRKRKSDMPDLFAEREKMLLHSYEPTAEPTDDAPRIGVPRALIFHDLYPFFHALLSELGCRIVLSNRTNKSIIHEGAERSVSETCFPVKIALGHIINLVRDKEIDYIFLPSVINLKKKTATMTDSFVCPYSQGLPYHSRAAVDYDAYGVPVLAPRVYFQYGHRHLMQAFGEMARTLGKSRAELSRALKAAQDSLDRFQQSAQKRGRQVLAELPDDSYAVVIVSRSYNGCDPGANLEIPRKLRDMGVLPIPMDFLPLDDVELPTDWWNMYWRYGQHILSAAEIIAEDHRLYPVYITNFGCGPDSFISHFFQDRLGGKPCLIIEVDEHSADAGMITRCEAFLDSIESTRGVGHKPGRHLRPLSYEKSTERTMLIPNMSIHAYGLAAAFEACGVSAEVLPEPDEETLVHGRRWTSGKECFPAVVTTGDMVKFALQPDFDRDRYAFFMGGSGGPCRFGQYNALQRMTLDDLGFEDVPIFAPNQESKYFGDSSLKAKYLLRRGWQGSVAMDMLYKARLEIKPYEITAGQTEQVLLECRDLVYDALASSRDVIAALEQSVERFAAIPTDRSVQKPVIGVTGEFYVRFNDFSNQNVIEQVESLGGEVWIAPAFEWFLYRNFRRDMRAGLDGDWLLRLKNAMMDKLMRRDEHTLAVPFTELLQNALEPSSAEVLEMAEPYIHCSFEGEAVMTIGKAVDFADKGLAGLISIMPFTCMPGTISHAVMRLVREDKDGIPTLNMVYDGSEQATALTRLEAFMYSAREYMRSRQGRLPQEADAAGH